MLEEDAFLICLKPPGIATTRRQIHGSEAAPETHEETPPSLADWIAQRYPECEAASQSQTRDNDANNPDCGICHRLDTETSGLMLVAKTPLFYQALREAFHAGRVEKEYVCLVEGRVEQEQEVQGYLYGRYRRSQKVHVSPHEVPRSQLAKLRMKPEQDVGTDLRKPFEASFLRIQLITGLRHQIRAQLASLGHPLVGDTLYGSIHALGEIVREVKPFAHISRQFLLHAEYIAFHHPLTNKRIAMRSPLEC
jgi:23S rRNA-/tRNA-specific pseudouridylate synthase